MPKAFLEFALESRYSDLPETSVQMAKRCLLDLIGVAFAGSQTELSRIVTRHAAEQFGGTGAPATILCSGIRCSPTGAALAGGMMIDSVDAHDGQILCKGHVGCGLFPSLLAMAEATGLDDGEEFLTRLVLGYEIGSRAGISLHASVPDYHTSGAWIAVACAALGARALHLDADGLRQAIGIAEYHGPRSQMMRAIDHPSMVKDGSGYGAMAGTSAAFLARDGFTGAPAITIESENVSQFWGDLGERWMIEEQYFKPYPVCYWAQGPIAATLDLVHSHNIRAEMVENVECWSFHEAIRLATRAPGSTEEAQYSLPFPVAVALVRGRVGPEDIRGNSLSDPQILKIAERMKLCENPEYSSAFPARRFASVAITLKDGTRYQSADFEPLGIPENPISDAGIKEKFLDYATPVIGEDRAIEIVETIHGLESDGNLTRLIQLVTSASTI